MTYTQKLAEYTTNLRHEELPEEVIDLENIDDLNTLTQLTHN